MLKNQESNSLFEVRLSNYSCPLDMLIELIKQKKINIAEISVLELIDQYNEFLKNSINDISIEEFADYLFMSSYLINLKTKVLLSGNDVNVKLTELTDTSNLLTKMIEYAKYKGSVEYFQELFQKRKTLIDKTHEDYNDYTLKEIPVGKLPKLINIEKLQCLYQKIINDIIENSIKYDDRLFREDITFVKYSIKDIQQKIIQYLQTKDSKQDNFDSCFRNNLDNDFSKGYFSAFFLAILSMIRYSIIVIKDDPKNIDNCLIQLCDEIDDNILEILNGEE